MKYLLTEDKVLIKPKSKEELTTGGLVIPNMDDEINMIGTIIQTGPGRNRPSGDRYPMVAQINDIVYFNKNHAYKLVDVYNNDEEYYVTDEVNILLLLREE